MTIYEVTLEAKGGAQKTRCVEAADAEIALSKALDGERVFTKAIEVRLSVSLPS